MDSGENRRFLNTSLFLHSISCLSVPLLYGLLTVTGKTKNILTFGSLQVLHSYTFHVYIGKNTLFNTAEIILFYYNPVVQLFNPCDFSKRVAPPIYFLLAKKKKFSLLIWQVESTTAVINNTEILYAGSTYKVNRNCSSEQHARTPHLRDLFLLFQVVSLKCIFIILTDSGPLLRAFLELLFQNNFQGLVHIALNSLWASKS